VHDFFERDKEKEQPIETKAKKRIPESNRKPKGKKKWLVL